MTLSRHAHLTTRAAWMGVLVLCLALLMLGCKGTRTVTLEAEDSTINAVTPDTTQETMLPPPEPPAPITQPRTVIVYEDTAEYDVDLSWLEVDRTSEDETVTVRTQSDSQSTERVFDLPAFGEALRLSADSQGLQGSVAGTPQERQREATAVEVPWWEQAKTQVRLLVAFAGGIVFGIFGARLFLP